MSLAERFLSFVTERSAIVVVVMLVLTVGMGAGMTSLSDESGLDQFQFESEESRALEYIEANYEAGEEETTAVQIVIRDDNVLTRDSFISTLELQEDLRDDEQINSTLTDERPFADLGEVVATTAIRQERAAALEAEREELTTAREELESAQAEIEADQEELESAQSDLEADREALQADQEEFEQRRAELEETAGLLSDGLNETRGLEQEFLELNASFERGTIGQDTYSSEAEQLSSALGAVGADAAPRLDDDSQAAYDSLLGEMRTLVGQSAQVERQFQTGDISEAERDQRLADIQTEIEALYGDIQTVVLAEEFAALEEQGTALEQRATDLQERGEELEQQATDLEERGEELEQRATELEEQGAALEERGEQLRTLDPTLAEQKEALETMDDDSFEAALNAVLGEDAPTRFRSFVPVDYESGSSEAEARQLFVTQSAGEEIVQGEAPPAIEESQLAIADIVDDRFGEDGFVFGPGIISDEINRSLGDSIAIVLPLAVLFVVVVLSIAYRDPLDIILGLFGIGLVLVWTFGFMGWAGIAFNQIIIAVPVLLVGLSIDYAIHVFMRHREQRAEDSGGSRQSMSVALSGLGAALISVTITAVIGFLSNLVSPVAPIREFGIVSAFGIAVTLLIFGTFVPAAKVGLDSFLEARGWDRTKRAFGTGGGLFTTLLSGGHTLAKRVPVAVVIFALLVTAAGAYGATQVDTTFQQEDFIADDPPELLNSLPEPFAPGEYSVKTNLEFVNERFLRQDATTQVLVEEDITADESLTDLQAATDVAEKQDVIVTFSGGEADIQSPLSAMQQVAAQNETFATTFQEADTTGDDVPDQNIESVYDTFFEVAPEQASDVIYRNEDGEYESFRMVLSVRGNALPSEATDSTREVAASLDTDSRPAIATGQLVVFNIVEEELFNTVLESLLVTLVAVFGFLMIAYRFVHGSAIFGAVTLTPIALTVAWILGTMFLLDISFNVLTGTITSLTIGLGVAYNIHMAERYQLELNRGKDVWESLWLAVTGTGGALLGSAATTVGGFGVLAFAILPPLQQFGIITGITIIYAFLGSVFILPSFLVLWTRYLGPAEKFPEE